MSLINSMLRDLDKRRAGDEARRSLPSAVRPLPAAGPERSPLRLVVLGVGVLAAGAYAWWSFAPASALKPAPLPPPPVAALNPPPAAVLPAPSLPAPAPQPAPRLFQGDARRIEPVAATSAFANSLRLDADLRQVPASPPAAPPAAPAPVATVKAAVVPPPTAPAAAPQVHAEPDDWQRAQALIRDGHADQAEPLLRRTLQQQAGNTSARQALLGILLPARRHAEAIDTLRQGLALSPEQSAWAMNLARLQAEGGDYPAAWEALQRGLPHAQQNADYQAFCGTVLQRLNRSPEAVNYYRAALRLKPREGRWWVGLGIALEAEGKAGEARESYQRARAIGELPPEVAAYVEQKLR